MKTLYVSNSSPLIVLQKLKRLDILEHLTQGTLAIAPAVEAEVFGNSLKPSWMMTRQPDHSFIERVSIHLDAGETAALALALELEAPLIIDEAKGRKEAKRLGLRFTGIGGVLLIAKQRRIISSVGALLDEIRKQGFWMSNDVYQELLQLAEESFLKT